MRDLPSNGEFSSNNGDICIYIYILHINIRRAIFFRSLFKKAPVFWCWEGRKDGKDGWKDGRKQGSKEARKQGSKEARKQGRKEGA